MAEYSIDFKKVDAAFQRLADSKEGNAVLEDLSRAFDVVGKQSKLNPYETKYVLSNLIEQRQGAQGPNLAKGGPEATVKSGFLIKTAVK